MVYWYFGPWLQTTDPDGHTYRHPPAGLSGLDLRSDAEQDQDGSGIFYGNVAPRHMPSDSGFEYLGNGSWHDIKTNQRMRDMFSIGRLRNRRTPGAPDLIGLILERLTTMSDVEGSDGPRPIMPNANRQIVISCGGMTYRQRFQWGRHPHAQKVKDTTQKQFERHMDDAEAGRLKDSQHHRRILDMMCEKYRVDDWHEFVPEVRRRNVEGRLPHATTITDDFTRADGTTIGNLLTWTELPAGSGDFETVSNTITKQSSSDYDLARADSDLSGDDHYSQIEVLGLAVGQGSACRMLSTSTRTAYICHNQSGTVYLDKLVSGSRTNLSNTSHTFAANEDYQVEADGSTIRLLIDASETLSVTDSSISGNVRCGVVQRLSSGASRMDNFEASDLGGGGAGVTYTQLESDFRGAARGTWVGGA